MKKLLTILFAVALGLNLSAQVPDYVPTDGLVAWYPLNGDVLDIGPTGMNGVNYGAQCDENRNQIPCEAMSFTAGDYLSVPADSSFTSQEGTMTGWVKLNSYAQSGASGYNHFFNRWEVNSHEFVFAANIYGLYIYVENELFQSDTLPNLNEWHHLAFSYSSISGMAKIYIDGQNIAEFEGVDTVTPTNHPLHIGGNPFVPAYNSVDGSMDDVGIWERTLELSEISALYNAQLPVPGCTDSIACNFNEEANEDDGGCIYPLFGDDCDDGGAACGEGTIWDSSLQSCVGFDQCPSDLNDDGIVGINDLLSLLSDFGTMCPIWMCGDLVNYHGYDYATVQIGDQCWFAENLRTELYQNGDEVPFVEAAAQWSSLTSGARRIYGSGDANCGLEGDTIGYCSQMAESVFALNGYLYNWHTVIDSRSICPGNWHVPNDVELEVLLDEAGNDDQGAISSLKSEEGWSEGNGGSNTSGFNALGSGYGGNLGNFSSDGHFTGFWSADDTGSSANASHLQLDERPYSSSEGTVFLNTNNKRYAHSIRCIKD